MPSVVPTNNSDPLWLKPIHLMFDGGSMGMRISGRSDLMFHTSNRPSSCRSVQLEAVTKVLLLGEKAASSIRV